MYEELKSPRKDNEMISQIFDKSPIINENKMKSDMIIDSREWLPQFVFQILSGVNENDLSSSSKLNPFISIEDLKEASKRFKDLHNISKQSKSKLYQQRELDLKKIQESINSLHRILYQSSDTSNPVISSPDLVEVEETLSSQLENVSKSIDQLIKQRSEKLQILSHNKDVFLSRRLFIDFYSNTQQFFNILEKLEKTVSNKN